MRVTHTSREANRYSGITPPDVVRQAEARTHWDPHTSRYYGACMNRSPDDSWVCTRDPKHTGWHVAHNPDALMAWWAPLYPDTLRVPEGM